MYAKIVCIPTVYPFYVISIQVHFYNNTIRHNVIRLFIDNCQLNIIELIFI